MALDVYTLQYDGYDTLQYDGYDSLHMALDVYTLQYDGYDSLHKLGDGLKGRVRVQFIDEHGEREAGVVSAV
jgi:hypothetical protein